MGNEGHVVLADTLGHKARFRSYRVDESQKSFELLGKKRPLEALGEVTATVFLHRTGWAAPGEVVLQRSRARLYRGRTAHILVGGPRTAVTCLNERENPFVQPPYLASGKQEAMPAPSETRTFVFIEDLSVKGVRSSGTNVELFAIERKEFLEFVVGKLRMILEFADGASASSFASNFLAADDPKFLDDFTVVDISRGTEIVPPTTPPGSKPGPEWTHRRELVDLRSKWPGLAWNRWAENVPGHAASFALTLQQLGVQTDTMRVDLQGLDGFLRGAPPDTLFAAFVMDAAAYIGMAFLATLAIRTRHRWVSVPATPPQPGLVLYFDEINVYVAPVTWLRKVWELKDPTSLHAHVAQWTYEVRNALAFRAQPEFAALAFTRTVREGAKEFRDRIAAEARQAKSTSLVLGERHLESRVLPFGEFEVRYVTGEVIEPNSSRYLPVIAVPFAARTQRWTGTLDGASPLCPAREDVAIVRLDGNELVPLGVQLANYAEVGSSFVQRRGPLALHALAAADKGQVLTPRVRQARPEVKDFLAPLDGTETGVPLSPYAQVLGSIEDTAEVINPITGLPLWRLRLNVSGFRCEVLVRKDRCEGTPSRGNFFTGRVWLVALLDPEPGGTDAYIR